MRMELNFGVDNRLQHDYSPKMLVQMLLRMSIVLRQPQSMHHHYWDDRTFPHQKQDPKLGSNEHNPRTCPSDLICSGDHHYRRCEAKRLFRSWNWKYLCIALKFSWEPPATKRQHKKTKLDSKVKSNTSATGWRTKLWRASSRNVPHEIHDEVTAETGRLYLLFQCDDKNPTSDQPPLCLYIHLAEFLAGLNWSSNAD